MSETAIFAISLGVTLLGLVISWGVARRRGAATGVRGAALSLVPIGAALTGVTGFFVDLVFDPEKWAGVVVLGLAVVLYLASGAMLARRSGGRGKAGSGDAAGASGKTRGGEPGGRRAASGKAPKGEVGGAQGADPEMAEIERILRDRGIS
ncbi:hypothetical protein [Actinomadura algeriensis]|uniref:Membrane protein implicated in regulation of membrane protease activity n=1 Tax=Actinomadura algeriensis TaxID=1679523 RepID=A0ABR9K059_9ACTN|nr:hypothetical protein [Actinomadura algeriensis]MBE1536207.1 membrane protein implicated in regulation of membrane protease activity [Actinomadura algeriensis]